MHGAQARDTSTEAWLPPDTVAAVQEVLVFLSREYGLLLGHIGRRLSLGRNTDVQTHLKRGQLSLLVANELVALCGQADLAVFLNLPQAPPEQVAHAVAALRDAQLIGSRRQNPCHGVARRWVSPPT